MKGSSLSRLTKIVEEILDVPPGSVDRNSAPRDFAHWDSAAHIDIVLSLEIEYGVLFGPEEIVEALSVAALEECLREKGVHPI